MLGFELDVLKDMHNMYALSMNITSLAAAVESMRESERSSNCNDRNEGPQLSTGSTLDDTDMFLVYQCQNEHAGFGCTRGVRLDIALLVR